MSIKFKAEEIITNGFVLSNIDTLDGKTQTTMSELVNQTTPVEAGEILTITLSELDDPADDPIAWQGAFVAEN